MKLNNKLYNFWLPSLCLVFIFNYLFTFFLEFQFNQVINAVNFYKTLSLIFSCLFFYLISKSITKAFSINSKSLAISTYLISFYLFDISTNLISIEFSFKTKFIILNVIWILTMFKLKQTRYTFSAVLVYFINFFFNLKFYPFISNLNNYVELNTDVQEQWYIISRNIYELGYLYSFQNNIIENQGLLASYLQSLIHLINFGSLDFHFVQTNSFIILFFITLLFFDLDISDKNKVYITILFLVFVINNDWMFYLIANSLMLEGLTCFVFSSYLININNYKKTNLNFSNLYFLGFGTLIFLKQFVSLISFIVIIYYFLNSISKEKVIYTSLPFILDFILKKVYFVSTSFVTYGDSLNFRTIFIDLINGRNIEISNFLKIIKQLYIDKPFVIILLFFLILNCITVIRTKSFTNKNLFYFYITLINFFLIVLLYITYWKTMEIESSYRYLSNLLPIYFVSIAYNLNFLERIS